MGEFWGSAGESAAATVDGVDVEVGVAVSDEDEIRIAAWSKDMAKSIELIFTEAEAIKVRDLLSVAIKEGRWLA